jgi:2'-5' RNA ligase
MDLRTFIAIELEPSLQLSLQNIQNELKSAGADISWVKPTNIHITLKFLGEIQQKKVKAITEIFPEIFQNVAAFPLELGGLGVFPNFNHPKVIWVDIKNGADGIKDLAMRVENALCGLGYPKERRPEFTAHVTIGRVRSMKNCRELVQAMQNFTFKGPLQQNISKIVFFKSTLHSQGSIYEPLATAELK